MTEDVFANLGFAKLIKLWYLSGLRSLSMTLDRTLRRRSRHVNNKLILIKRIDNSYKVLFSNRS